MKSALPSRIGCRTPYLIFLANNNQLKHIIDQSDLSHASFIAVRAPPILRLGVHNSFIDKELPQAGVCRITLYVPYWLSNRTGVDLFFKDPECAPPNPFVFGAALPWGYGEVFAPGTSMTEAFDKGIMDDSGSKVQSGLGGLNSWMQSHLNGSTAGAQNQALLEYKLVLMNKQDELALGLAHVKKRRFSQPVPIKTVGNKGSVELRGPPSKPSIHRMTFDVIRKTASNAANAAANAANAAANAANTAATAAVHAPAAAAEIIHQVVAAGLDQHPNRSAEEQLLSLESRRTSRHSIGNRTVDVVSTKPGTMLVRLTSADQSGTSLRKMPAVTRFTHSPMQGRTSIPEASGIGISIDEEADAVLEDMQKVPPTRRDIANLENPEGAPAPSRQQLSEAMVGPEMRAPGSPGGSGAGHVPEMIGASPRGSIGTSPSMTAQRFIDSTSGLQEAAEVAAIHGTHYYTLFFI